MPRSSRPLTRSWNAFFSSLARAEQAAARQCELVADGFEARGEQGLATRYREYAEEELGHFALASSVCREFIEPTARARQAYDGGLMSGRPSILERLAVVHIGFEPSALAYLGHLYRHADELLGSPGWAEQVRESFGPILREEVLHVHAGRGLILSEWARASAHERSLIVKTLRRYRAFLSLGLGSFFGEPHPECLPGMVSDYRRRVDALTRDLAA